MRPEAGVPEPSELPADEGGLALAVELTGLALHQVRTAARYYAE